MKIAPKTINKQQGQPFTLTCAGPFLTLLHISVHANERAIHATECRRGIGTVSCSEFLPRPTRCGAVAPVTPLRVIALDSFHYNRENRKCFIQGLVCECLTAFYWFKLGSLSTRAFETRTATGREHSVCQDSGVSHIFILIIHNREKVLSIVNVMV